MECKEQLGYVNLVHWNDNYLKTHELVLLEIQETEME